MSSLLRGQWKVQGTLGSCDYVIATWQTQIRPLLLPTQGCASAGRRLLWPRRVLTGEGGHEPPTREWETMLQTQNVDPVETAGDGDGEVAWGERGLRRVQAARRPWIPRGAASPCVTWHRLAGEKPGRRM